MCRVGRLAAHAATGLSRAEPFRLRPPGFDPMAQNTLAEHGCFDHLVTPDPRDFDEHADTVAGLDADSTW